MVGFARDRVGQYRVRGDVDAGRFEDLLAHRERVGLRARLGAQRAFRVRVGAAGVEVEPVRCHVDRMTDLVGEHVDDRAGVAQAAVDHDPALFGIDLAAGARAALHDLPAAGVQQPQLRGEQARLVGQRVRGVG